MALQRIIIMFEGPVAQCSSFQLQTCMAQIKSWTECPVSTVDNVGLFWPCPKPCMGLFCTEWSLGLHFTKITCVYWVLSLCLFICLEISHQYHAATATGCYCSSTELHVGDVLASSGWQFLFWYCNHVSIYSVCTVTNCKLLCCNRLMGLILF